MFRLFLLLNLSAILISSCNSAGHDSYIGSLDQQQVIQLQKWNYAGPFKYADSSNDYLNKDHLFGATGVTESDFSKDPASYRLTAKKELLMAGGSTEGFQEAKVPIVDFDWICNSRDTSIKPTKGSAIYLFSNLISEKEQKVFLLLRSAGLKLWLNGEEIYKTYDGKRFELFFEDYVRLTLKKGRNTLLIKRIINTADILLEARLCNWNYALEQYHQSQAGLILYNSIAKDSLRLKNNHAKDLDTNITYNIQKPTGEILYSKTLSATTRSVIPIDRLPVNQSYFCSFTMGGRKFAEPFYKGSPDTALLIFKKKRSGFLKDDHALQQIDAYLFRLDTLMKQDSRKTDWWWPHKTSNIIYELENTFKNLETGHQLSENTFGIQLKAFTSKLDFSTQHYLLITPDSIKKTEQLPLVLVIRPVMTNQHHFLTSPQISRYWSLTYAKYLADKYRYIILMPAARLYTNEDLIPMAEPDIMQAIEEAANQYPVDMERLYLHGNCTAGYRSLVLACHYPGRFAAIGLYAPVYEMPQPNAWEEKNSPQKLLDNLCNIPLMLHYDSIDRHNPYENFKSLIKDCRKKGLQLQVSADKFSGLYYNVQLVGEEAFAFFKDKKRIKKPPVVKLTFTNESHRSAYWLSGAAISKNIPGLLEAQYHEKKNDVTIFGNNICTIALNTKLLTIDKTRPFNVQYNGKTVFNGNTGTFNDTLLLNVASQPKTIDNNNLTAQGLVIADLFSSPFLFVAEDKRKAGDCNATDSLVEEYESSLFSKCPIRYIGQIDQKDLQTKNIFLIGHHINNNVIMAGLRKLPLNISDKMIKINGKTYRGEHLIFQAIFRSPFNPQKYLIVYSSNEPNNFAHSIRYPWKRGLDMCIVQGY